MSSTTPGSEPGRADEAIGRARGGGGRRDATDESTSNDDRGDRPTRRRRPRTPTDETTPDDAAVDEAARERPAVEEVALADEPAPEPSPSPSRARAEPEPATPPAYEPERRSDDVSPRRGRRPRERRSCDIRDDGVDDARTTSSTRAGAGARRIRATRDLRAGSTTVAAGTAAGAATLAPEPRLRRAAARRRRPSTCRRPTAPKAKGNRGFGVLVAAHRHRAVRRALRRDRLPAAARRARPVGRVRRSSSSRAVFWVPVVAFFVGFTLLAVDRQPRPVVDLRGVRPAGRGARVLLVHRRRAAHGAGLDAHVRRGDRLRRRALARPVRDRRGRRSPARSRSGSAAGSPHAAAPSPSATGSRLEAYDREIAAGPQLQRY